MNLLPRHFVLLPLALALVAGCGGRADLGGESLTPHPGAHQDAGNPARDEAGAGGEASRGGASAGDDASLGPNGLEGGMAGAGGSKRDAASSANDGNGARGELADATSPTGTTDAAYPSSCRNNTTDGTETDVDCGGDACPPCGRDQACRTDSDCGSSPGCDPNGGCACDAVSKTCVYDHCLDRKQDGTETDVDCGGECAGCGPNKGCRVDTDCSETLAGCNPGIGGCACDAISFTCVYDHCFDHKQNSGETAADCGGGACPGCATGQACELDYDCVSNACDGTSAVCVLNQCEDRRQDGVETDVDCGGADSCAGCKTGRKCLYNSDCLIGHTCVAGTPHVCD